MTKLSLYCRNCTGKVYEEEIYEEKGTKIMQLGCLHCSHKIYVPLFEWNTWKEKMEQAIIAKKVRTIKEQPLLPVA